MLTPAPGHDAQQSELLLAADAAFSLSYSPYSLTKIAAALRGFSGRIYSGGNIGNSCSALNCCAEQVAIIQAVIAKDYPFQAIAIVQNSNQACPPCGRCLQLLAEFSTDMTIISRHGETPVVWRLSYLLPIPFRRTEGQQP
jgi:cytidine deaminase